VRDQVEERVPRDQAHSHLAFRGDGRVTRRPVEQRQIADRRRRILHGKHPRLTVFHVKTMLYALASNAGATPTT
jgi:aromatic ring-cleaving dioxygenase